MRKDNFNPESRKEATEISDALDKAEVSKRTKLFFQKFTEKSYQTEKIDLKENERKIWEEEVRVLDENTAPEPVIWESFELEELLSEEFQQLEESDPGYVNELVLDYDNEKKNPRNIYRETGSHTEAIRWGEYAVENSERYEVLQPGTKLSRWGNDNGIFMAAPQTAYEKLELPVVQEKQELNLYEVCKPFPVERSFVKKQPWNKDNSDNEVTVQYRMPASIKQLVEENYLHKL